MFRLFVLLGLVALACTGLAVLHAVIGIGVFGAVFGVVLGVLGAVFGAVVGVLGLVAGVLTVALVPILVLVGLVALIKAAF